jgi:hypothetical protein
MMTSFSCWKYHTFAFPASENGKSLTLNSSVERSEYELVEHNFSKLFKWWYGFSPSNPKKGFFWAMERNFGEILPLKKNLGLRFSFVIGIFVLGGV